MVDVQEAVLDVVERMQGSHEELDQEVLLMILEANLQEEGLRELK